MLSKYQGVILAAGKGSRMYPFSEDLPKPLLPICNKALIEYQLQLMYSAGIRDVIILIGHLGAKIVNYLGNGSNYRLKIQYVEQKNMLGIAHALGTLEQFISKPFLLFLGDIFFETTNLLKMFQEFESGHINAVLATKIEKDKESIKRNFAIIENNEGFVQRVIEKPQHIMNNLKGCGIYLFDLHIFDAIRRTPRTAMRDEYELTDSIQILIDDGFKVKKSNIILKDTNLTNPEDLLKVNLVELKRRQLNRLIGKKVSLKNRDMVLGSIIGNNVVIENGIKIRNSLIFQGTVVSQKTTVKNAILFSNKIITI